MIPAASLALPAVLAVTTKWVAAPAKATTAFSPDNVKLEPFLVAVVVTRVSEFRDLGSPCASVKIASPDAS